MEKYQWKKKNQTEMDTAASKENMLQRKKG